jgi:hypothetical protein
MSDLQRAIKRVFEYRGHITGCEINQTDVCTCGLREAVDELDAAWKAVGERQIRLRKLALHGAKIAHEWWFDPTENLDELPPDGHEQPFATCPHPDCVVVRS